MSVFSNGISQTLSKRLIHKRGHDPQVANLCPRERPKTIILLKEHNIKLLPEFLYYTNGLMYLSRFFREASFSLCMMVNTKSKIPVNTKILRLWSVHLWMWHLHHTSSHKVLESVQKKRCEIVKPHDHGLFHETVFSGQGNVIKHRNSYSQTNWNTTKEGEELKKPHPYMKNYW